MSPTMRGGGSRYRDLQWATLLTVCVAVTSTYGNEIYVDSRVGRDALDGSSPRLVNEFSGPVQTIRRAVQLLEPGDRIIIANNGTPYEGGITMFGPQQSGVARLPVEIIGNGAILTGAKPIEPSTWRLVTGDVWRITPSRKGWYQLVMDGRAVPEIPCDAMATELPALEEGTWCVFQGAIYYRPPFGVEPSRQPLQLADEQTGITLLGVQHVVIRDLTLQHFRQDGVHLHDRCSDIVLENVTSRENGRCGIVVRGTSRVLLSNVTSTGNREESLLVEGLGVADAADGTFEPVPTVRQ